MRADGFRAHPWHGVDVGAGAPAVLTAYIEIVPTDTIKYEVDKTSGILGNQADDKLRHYFLTCKDIPGAGGGSRSRTSAAAARHTR